MTNLTEIAYMFRRRIEIAKNKGCFKHGDRMARFPYGCCDDATDLFAHYLWENYHLRSTRIDGTLYAEDSECNCYHTWLELDGIIFDLTADQLGVLGSPS